MSDSITVSKGFTGLNNKIDPTRLKFDPETGIGELASAVDVDIDDTGRVYRRDGYALRDSGVYESLFSLGDTALAVKDSYIGTLDSDFTFTALSAVTAGAPVSYAQVGLQTYYMNGYQKGIITEGAHSAWTGSAYVGIETNKTFDDPPLGHFIAVYNGRMWIAQQSGNYNLLYASRPFAYAWYNLAADFIQFPGRTRMLMPVADGLYIASAGKVYFLQGTVPREMAQREVATCGVYEGSAVKVPGYKVGLDIQGECVMWGSPEGIWIGAAGGVVFNLTEKFLVLPDSTSAAGYYTGEKYYCNVES